MTTLRKCAFCNKTEMEVTSLLSNRGEGKSEVCICNDCVAAAVALFQPEADVSNVSPTPVQNVLTPTQMVDFLNQYVVGQDSAKRTLAIAVYNHYKRLANP